MLNSHPRSRPGTGVWLWKLSRVTVGERVLSHDARTIAPRSVLKMMSLNGLLLALALGAAAGQGWIAGESFDIGKVWLVITVDFWCFFLCRCG